MRIQLYWLQKIRAFRSKAYGSKQNRRIRAIANRTSKDTARPKNSQHASEENIRVMIRSSNLSFTSPRTNVKYMPKRKLSRVIASFGCGSTSHFHEGKFRNQPEEYDESGSESCSQDPSNKMNGACHQKLHSSQNCDRESGSIKDRHMPVYTSAKMKWVRACRCINDVITTEKGSLSSEGVPLNGKPAKGLNIVSKADNDGERTLEIIPTEGKMSSVSERKTQPCPARTEGSISDRVIGDCRKKIDLPVRDQERWSSASVKDCILLPGSCTPIEFRTEDSECAAACLRRKYFEKRQQLQQQSMTSISTLSSYEFDRNSESGCYDARNMSFRSVNKTHGWQDLGIERGNYYANTEECSSEQRATGRSLNGWCSSAMVDPDVSVISYTLSDYESETEDEQILLHTISHAKVWMNQSMRNSNSTTTTTTIDDNYNKNCHHHHCNTDNDDDDVEDDHIDDDDDDDDDDYDDSDCLIDMESNSKGWTMAWALAPSDVVLPITEDFNCSMLMRCNSSGNSCTSQKELSAAVLKKKYHKEFTEQQQAVVVSSHCEDNMHTFTFPNTYDYNLDGREKISNHVSTKSKTENQGCLITNDNESFGGLFQNSYYQHFAVEKKSQNPYVDFHNSMVEMVLHKQMHEATELEELLQLFLSLNSLEHHELIVQAFCDVWEKVFGRYMESTK